MRDAKENCEKKMAARNPRGEERAKRARSLHSKWQNPSSASLPPQFSSMSPLVDLYSSFPEVPGSHAVRDNNNNNNNNLSVEPVSVPEGKDPLLIMIKDTSKKE